MLSKFLTITNATKAQIISAINGVFAVLIAFHVVFTQQQLGAIDIAVNAVLSLFVATTFTMSAKRAHPAHRAQSGMHIKHATGETAKMTHTHPGGK